MKIFYKMPVTGFGFVILQQPYIRDVVGKGIVHKIGIGKDDGDKMTANKTGLEKLIESMEYLLTEGFPSGEKNLLRVLIKKGKAFLSEEQSVQEDEFEKILSDLEFKNKYLNKEVK